MPNFYGKPKPVQSHATLPSISWLEPPASDDKPPQYRYFTSEMKIVASNVVHISPNNGWQTHYPFSVKGSETQQVLKGRLYAANEISRCDQCGGQVAPWIERFHLRGGTHCKDCSTDAVVGSYLGYELDRKPKQAIVSQYQGYIADDPNIHDLPLWQPGTMTHFGAAMGTGKTTLIFNQCYESKDDAITLILTPRTALAQGLWNEQIHQLGSRHGWGLFHGGSNKNNRIIGKFGAIGTLPSLGSMLQVIIKDGKQDQPIRIFIDEIDFATNLIHADILKYQSRETKDLMRRIIDKTGMVVAGQTEMTAILESTVAEFGIDPENNLFGYYNTAPPAEERAEVYQIDSVPGENAKNEVVAAIIKEAETVIAAGRNAYCLVDERRSAQIIAQIHPDALLFDRYHRGNQRNRDLLYSRQLTDSPLLVTSNAVNVGITLRDDNAETIVGMVLNPVFAGNLASTVQKGLRNRQKPPLSLFFIKYNNPLPIAPTDAEQKAIIYEKQKLSRDEYTELPKHLIALQARRHALETLAEDQPETFIKHHWEAAGYEVNYSQSRPGQYLLPDFYPCPVTDVDVETVKVRRKMIKDTEKEAVYERAREIVRNREVMTEDEIRNAGEDDNLHPVPIEHLSHEHANEVLQFVGWHGEVYRYLEDGTRLSDDIAFSESVTPAQWKSAELIIGMDMDKCKRWRRGYLGVHFAQVAHQETQRLKSERQLELIHIPDDRNLGVLLRALLRHLPRAPADLYTTGKAILNACQERAGRDLLSASLKSGALGMPIAKQVRFLNLGTDAEPTEALIKWASQFISNYYPARIARFETPGKDGLEMLYQLAPAADKIDKAFTAKFLKVVKCYLAHRYPEMGNGKNYDLLPSEETDPHAAEREIARQMRAEGKTVREIEKATEMSLGWVSEHTKDIHKSDTTVDLKAEVRRLKADGKTIREIKEVTGKSLGWISKHTKDV